MKWRSLSEDEINRMPVDQLRQIGHDIQEWLALAKAAVVKAEMLLSLVQMHHKAKSGSRED